jgi:hypothetical protein
MEMIMENFWNDVERRKLKHMEKALLVILCVPQILHGLTWDALRSSLFLSLQLIA